MKLSPGTMRLHIIRYCAAAAACLLAIAGISRQVTAQINLQGIVSPQGILNISTTNSSTQTHQFTHIWAFAPPNTDEGAEDNTNFVSNVMNQGSVPVDGASVLEAWNSIEKVGPTSLPCSTSDVCQPDPGVPGMFHTYDWSTYDSTALSGTPVYQWIKMSGKKVNLLITGEASGPTNPITPHYVTSPAWYDLFTPQQQDVINAFKDCSGLWAGTSPNGGATYDSTSNTVTVTDTVNCCNPPGTTSQSSLVQDQDLVWVTASPSTCGTGSAGKLASVGSMVTNMFSYTPSGTCSNPVSNVMYISAAQSWAVPYEYPYKSALKAYWAAVVAHYGPNFTLNSTNYYPGLNYFRFGGSVGSEWYPYCTSGGASGGLESLSSPYKYWKQIDAMHAAPPYTGWLNYYQEMGNYLQSLAPPFQIIHSINAAETPPDYTYGTSEAGYAIGWSNRFGVRDGFGSQGLSVQDQINCTTGPGCNTGAQYSASNWYPLFQQYNTYGAPLELQPIALSYEGDTTCTHGCSVSTYSGDLPTFLYSFATSVGGTDFEIYWRDLSLSYDVTNYCHLVLGACQATTSVTPGGQINPSSLQITFFQGVGQGDTNPYCSGNSPQSGAHGNCAYQNNINEAHGQH
jgi:hypothetical protein